eukprot:4232376-Pleurochrysis_carterae.AAC.2
MVGRQPRSLRLFHEQTACDVESERLDAWQRLCKRVRPELLASHLSAFTDLNDGSTRTSSVLADACAASSHPAEPHARAYA